MLCSKISFERIWTPAKELIHTTTTLKNTQNTHWVSVSAVRNVLAGALLFSCYSNPDTFVALFIVLSSIWRCSTSYWQKNPISAEALARMCFLLLHLFLWGFGLCQPAQRYSSGSQGLQVVSQPAWLPVGLSGFGREVKWQLMPSSFSASCSSWPWLSHLAEQVLLMWFQIEGHKLLVKWFAHIVLHFRLSFSKVNIGIFMIFWGRKPEFNRTC